MSDPVKHPSHYMLANGIECIDVVQHFNFNRGGAIKYVWRAGKKDPATELQDLEKAAELLAFEIKRLREKAAPIISQHTQGCERLPPHVHNGAGNPVYIDTREMLWCGDPQCQDYQVPVYQDHKHSPSTAHVQP